MHYCPNCNQPLSSERIRALINFKSIDQITCVNCSSEQKRYAVMVYPHKTGGETVSIDSSNAENVRKARRFNERAR